MNHLQNGEQGHKERVSSGVLTRLVVDATDVEAVVALEEGVALDGDCRTGITLFNSGRRDRCGGSQNNGSEAFHCDGVVMERLGEV